MAATYEDRFWTSSDGLNLHYRNYPGPDGAEALPVLCMHGLTRNARDFAALENANWFEELVASGFTVAQPVGVFPRLELPAESA